MTSLTPLFDLVRSPPRHLPGTTLAGIFKGLQAEPDNIMQRTYTGLLETLGISRDHHLARTGITLAKLIDWDVRVQGGADYGGYGNAYHNRNHMIEVTGAAALLLSIHEREKFKPEFTLLEKLLGLTAALGHDLGHDGRGNGMGEQRVPLLNETRSLKLAEPIMAESYGRYRQPQMQEMFSLYRALITSTDIGGGADSPARVFIESAAHARGERAEPPVVDTPERQYFYNLIEMYPNLAELSCLLQDADLLPATSITPEWVQRQEKTLGQENPERLTVEGRVNWDSALWFQNNLAAPKSLAGKTFAANHAQIKDYVQEMARRHSLEL